MENTYNELNNYNKYLIDETNNIKAAIEYTERFLMDDAPEFYAKHITEMENELREATEELRIYTEYEKRIAAY